MGGAGPQETRGEGRRVAANASDSEEGGAAAPTRRDQPQQSEVGEAHRAFERLGAHDPLHRGEPDMLRGSRISVEQCPATTRSFKRQAGGRIACDVRPPNRGDQAVLIDLRH